MMRIAAVAGAMLVIATPAIGANDLFRCSALDAAALTEEGALTADGLEFFIGYYADFIVDSLSGVVRFGSAQPQQWEVAQRGSDVNDIVLVPFLDPAMAATDFIRIRTWAGAPTVFILFALSRIVTGTCETI